jgi:PncC family amidohydrolase
MDEEAPASADSAEVGKALAGARLTVAVAESCTGGLLAGSLTEVAGASAYFVGGVVAYSDEVKVRELGVDPATIRERGAVSRETAEEMASGIARRFGADIGVSVTGIAGPGGGSAEKPVGTVWLAVSLGGEIRSRGERFRGDRARIREESVRAAMALLLNAVQRRQG